MKRKILIALIVVLALSISVLAGCNLSIMSIELKSGTLATVYYVGDTVDMSKAKITVTKSDGTTEDVALTSAMLDKAISTTEAGKTTYTITYENKTSTFEVEVKLPTLSIKAGTLNTNYYVGDEVSYNGAKIVVKNGDAAGVDVDLTADMVNPAISTAKAGTTTHTITYNGATTTFEVTVSAPVISLVDGSLKLEYLVGETVDMSGAKISVKCGNRPEVQVGFEKVTLDKEITTTATGKTTYTVSYNGATTTFEVTVRQVAEITSVSLDDEFIKDQQVSLDGVTLTVKYTDDTTGEVALTWDMIYAIIDGQVAASHATSIDTTLGTDVAEKTLKYAVKYGGKSKEIEITVKDTPVKSIAVSNEFATDYYVGYAIPNFTGNHLVVTLDNEAESVRRIALTNATFEPALPETFTAGTYDFTLTYRDKTASLTINVYDVELQLVESNTTYYVGDDIFDAANKLIGYKIKVVATDGTVREDNLDVTSAMVQTPVFSTETAGGDKSLVIEYKGKTLPINNIVVNPVTISLATGDDAMNTKFVQGSTPTYTGKIVVTYTPTRTKTVDITSAMFAENPITTTELGEKEYTLKYLGATTTVIIKVVPAQKTEFNSFLLPDFTKGQFKVMDNLYEVGNVNRFILQPSMMMNATDIDKDNVWTIAKLRIKETANGEYRDMTANEIAEYVTIVNNTYKFDEGMTSIGTYVELTVTADPDFYTCGESITAERKLEFKIVDKGYNVYDQMGLAVMTDAIRPEFWADILGCEVSEDGQYVPNATPTKLPADDNALYTYIGNVNWVVIHNDITIDPANMPADYFWKSTDAEYNTALNNINGYGDEAHVASMKAQLVGSLKDGNGSGSPFYVSKYTSEGITLDSNNNKGLYATNKVKISGNYHALTVKSYEEGDARQLRVVVHKDSQKYPLMRSSQWHLFKMDEGHDSVSAYDFVIKNVALKGNTGHYESNAPQGVTMLENFSKSITIDNIIAEGFYNALTQDNFRPGDTTPTQMNIKDTKISNIFSSMCYTWRGTVNVINSTLTNSGGPLFIMGDGTRFTYDEDKKVNGKWTPGENDAVATINVDEDSVLETDAMGNEAWYTQLGETVPDMFNSLNSLNQVFFVPTFKKSFFHNKAGTNIAYASIHAVVLPDMSNALGNDDFAVAAPYHIYGKYSTPEDSFNMVDDKFTTLTDNLAGLGLGTILFKSGNNYAWLLDGQGHFASYEFAVSLLTEAKTAEGQQAIVAAGGMTNWIGAKYMAWTQTSDCQTWATNWAQSPNTLQIWMKGTDDVTNAKCPYLGIIIDDFVSVAQQG